VPPAPTVIGKPVAEIGTFAGPARGVAGKVNGDKVGAANLNPPAPPAPPIQEAEPPPPPATTTYSTALQPGLFPIADTQKVPGPVKV
jgi:hypothetical protein